MSNCCICKTEVNSENAPILMMSAYGLPKYICPKCEAALDITETSENPQEIADACKTLGDALTQGDTGDTSVINTVNTIIKNASEKCEAIKNGTYSPDADAESAEEEFELTEDLLESEEDRAKDEKEARIGKIVDTVISWAAGIALVAAIAIFIIKFVL